MHKECITLLRRIFEEELQLLDNKILDTKKHVKYLESASDTLHTYYHFKLNSTNTGDLSIIDYKEIPFLKDQMFSSSTAIDSNTSDVHMDDIKSFLIRCLGTEYCFERVHCELEGTIVSLKVYLSIPYKTLSATAICYYYYYKSMNQVHFEFSKSVMDLYYSNELSSSEISILMSKYQHHIELYMNALKSRLYTTDTNFDIRTIAIEKTYVDIYKKIHHGLRAELKYMERHCPEYFDTNKNMPFYVRTNFFKKYTKDAESLQKMIKDQNLPLQMEEEICKPLLDIIKSTSTKSYSYNHRTYYRTYIHVLSRLLSKQGTYDHDKIYGLLIALDFNTHQVGILLTDEFLVRLESCADEYEKKIYLYQEMRRIKRIPVTSVIRYHPEFPSLKEYLLSYMNQCLDYTTQSLDVKEDYRNMMGTTHTAIPIEKEQVPKRKVNLSISEFALFSRLFVEVGMISLKEGKKQRFFKFLSSTFTSKDTLEISEGSIRNGFYKISDTTFSNVEKKLLQLLHTLRVLRNSKPI